MPRPALRQPGLKARGSSCRARQGRTRGLPTGGTGPPMRSQLRAAHRSSPGDRGRPVSLAQPRAAPSVTRIPAARGYETTCPNRQIQSPDVKCRAEHVAMVSRCGSIGFPGSCEMDFQFDSEEEAFRDEIRAFVTAELPREFGAPAYNDREDSPESQREMARRFQRKLAEKRWLTLAWPIEHGGLGAGPMKQLVYNEEMSAL